MKQQVQIQKEEVKKIFLSSTNNSIAQKLNFIDLLQRLGISYHFEREIDDALEQIHNTFTNNEVTTEEGGLHFLALSFRLLRQKGHHISSGIYVEQRFLIIPLKSYSSYVSEFCRQIYLKNSRTIKETSMKTLPKMLKECGACTKHHN